MKILSTVTKFIKHFVSRHKYSDIYSDYCLSMIKLIESKIDRKLTNNEINGVKNAGSIMMLESLENSILHSKSKIEAEEILRDSIEAFKSRFEDSIPKLIEVVETKLGRKLNDNERLVLLNIKNNEQVIIIADRLSKARNKEKGSAQNVMLEIKKKEKQFPDYNHR